jgi:hypothetical protein
MSSLLYAVFLAANELCPLSAEEVADKYTD